MFWAGTLSSAFAATFWSSTTVRPPTSEWVPPNGHSKALPGRSSTDEVELAAVVLVKAKRMQEPWCLATSLAESKAGDVVKLYSRRFTIEEAFRDTKDIHFGMGLSATHIRDERRRDRLLLLVAIAQSLLTLLGAASEKSGLDRYLKNGQNQDHVALQPRRLLVSLPAHHARRLVRTRLIYAYDTIVREHEVLRRVLRSRKAPSDHAANEGMAQVSHLEHLERSLDAEGSPLSVLPARCVQREFEFRSRERFRRPGRCPECKSRRRVQPPRFF